MQGSAESVRRCRSRWGAIRLPEARGIRQPFQAGLADPRTRASCENRVWNRPIALVSDVGRRRSVGPRGARGGTLAPGADYLRGQGEGRIGRIARAWLPGKGGYRVLSPLFLALPADALGRDGAADAERGCSGISITGSMTPAESETTVPAHVPAQSGLLLGALDTSRSARALRFVCHAGDRWSGDLVP